MSGFEDFIRDELPLRQVVIKSSGDPTTGDGVIAAIGTYYLDNSNNFKRYEKMGSGNTDWRAVPTTSTTGAVSTDTVQFADDSEITTVSASGISGNQTIDTFSVSSFKSAKYILQATSSDSITCSEILLLVTGQDVQLSHYGILGNSELIDVTATIENNLVSLVVNSQLVVDVTLMRFALS